MKPDDSQFELPYGGSEIKNLPAMQETPVQFGLGRFPGEGNGYLLQYSGLENSMDRGAWQATVHGATKIQTQLSNRTITTIITYVRH